MNYSRLAALVTWVILLSGCVGNVPYRTAGFGLKPDCQALYQAYGKGEEIAGDAAASPCWLSSRESAQNYDLLFAEFDDQGWLQGESSGELKDKTHIDRLIAQLEQILDQHRGTGLSLVVYVHGWQHNAEANDANVREIRALLNDIRLAEADENRHVVGVYVGWRGKSLDIPLLRYLTFWQRKDAAKRVAQGSVRELFFALDRFRDKAGRNPGQDRAVRMLTLAHSFGGLVTFEALSGELIRDSVNFEREYFRRLGDLVVIANPAFEGARFEPLKSAARHLTSLRPDQLPVIVLATSSADWATRLAFPAARWFDSVMEYDPGVEEDANLKTVGHNQRYMTHTLTVCDPANRACHETCPVPDALPSLSAESAQSGSTPVDSQRGQHILNEKQYIDRIVAERRPMTGFLCDGLELRNTDAWIPRHSPFWVVKTSGDVMADHGDIFNPHFVAFVRQIYMAVRESTKRTKRHDPVRE